MSDRARPKYATRPGSRRRHLEDDVRRVARAMGFDLMPWQARSARVVTEYRVRDRVPWRKTGLITVPRQSGKSVLISALAVSNLLAVPERYSVLIAQTRIAATSRLRDIARRAIKSGLDPDLHFTRGVGNERIIFSNDSRLEVMSPKATSVHGESISGMAIIDEAFAVPSDILSGVIPAMVAHPQSQLIVISTAGTEDSELLNEMTDRAREDPQGDIAFVEYSMPDDAHPYETERWGEWMPALGYTASISSIEMARSRLSLPEFRRAFCNITISEDLAAAIPIEWWDASASDVVPEVGLCLAVDVNRSPPGWSIAAAWDTDDPDGYHADLVHHHLGLELAPIVPKMAELMARFKPAAIGLDPIGPAGALLPDFQKMASDAAIPLRTFNGRERAMADVFLFELLRDGSFTHSEMLPLTAAAQGAIAAEKGDLWYFSRRSSYVDLSPLLATSMAVWCAKENAVLAPVFAIY